ncbi:MAG: protein translocase subunit SecD, partial [Pseudomonadota bacterium]
LSLNFRLNGAGQQRFSKVTQENVNRRFAIVLDERVMSAPNIREPIYGGQVQISGGFPNNAAGLQEAIDLAAIIEAGELPAKLNFIEERTVGPGLGEDSIRAGTLASLIGLALVALSMAVIYGRLGIFAVTSLTANIVLILGALSGLGATLTLPGIAGIILTIGMAVDANVLVFERIREESRSGRSALTAVQVGYEKAMSTILDANITTFIAAGVLYMLGSGPVKGFAVTLAIGIITSVFTAFVVTRWFTVMWLRWARPKTLSV